MDLMLTVIFAIVISRIDAVVSQEMSVPTLPVGNNNKRYKNENAFMKLYNAIIRKE